MNIRFFGNKAEIERLRSQKQITRNKESIGSLLGMMLRLTARVAEAKKLGLATMSSTPDTRPNSLAVPHTCGAGQIPSGPVKLGENNPEFVPTSYKRRETGQATPQVTEYISLLQPITRLSNMLKFRNVIAGCVVHARA